MQTFGIRKIKVTLIIIFSECQYSNLYAMLCFTTLETAKALVSKGKSRHGLFGRVRRRNKNPLLAQPECVSTTCLLSIMWSDIKFSPSERVVIDTLQVLHFGAVVFHCNVDNVFHVASV